MSVTETPTGMAVSFRCRLPDGTKHRERVTLRGVSKTAAKAWEQKRRNALVSGEAKPASLEMPLFKDYATEWLKVYSAGLKPATRAGYDIVMDKHLVPYFGALRLDAPEWTRRVLDFKAKVLGEDGKKHSTLNKDLVLLKACLEAAQRDQIITSVPLIELVALGDPTFHYWTRPQLEALVAAAYRHGHRWGVMAQTAAMTGMRIGELEALAWTDVDFARREIYVQHNNWKGIIGTPKNNIKRRIPIPTALATTLEAYRHKRQYVFSSEDGALCNRDAANWAIEKACSLADLPKHGWHTVRHSFATHLAMMGVAARTIQTWLGHKNISMTDRYMHFAPEYGVQNPFELTGQSADKLFTSTPAST